MTELAVVMAILAFVVIALLNRAKIYQEQAEKTAMTEVAGAIQHQLLMNYEHLLVQQGGGVEIAAMAKENPMSWMDKVPDNYAGEFYDPLPDAVTPGSWFFDLKSRELAYLPERADNLAPGADGNKWIHYRVELRYAPASGEHGNKLVESILFEPSEPYHWFN